MGGYIFYVDVQIPVTKVDHRISSETKQNAIRETRSTPTGCVLTNDIIDNRFEIPTN